MFQFIVESIKIFSTNIMKTTFFIVTVILNDFQNLSLINKFDTLFYCHIYIQIL